jgi:hypothetical protein
VIERRLQDMAAYLQGLVLEFGDEKKRLSKLQRWAEAKNIDDAQWEERQDKVWSDLQRLEQLRDVLQLEGGHYGAFRKTYQNVLADMRAALGNRRKRGGEIAATSGTTPLPPRTSTS